MKSEDTQKVIDLLIRHELALAHLYETYACAIPDLRDFWHEMAVEERAHADVLQSLTKMLHTHKVFYDQTLFTAISIETVIDYVNKLARDATSGQADRLVLLSSALDLEQSVIEKNYFRVFKTDELVMQDEFEQLVNHTREHVGRIEQHLSAERRRHEQKGSK